MITCYYCDSEATTVEHVPPKCIFPGDSRMNLITVPACSRHNNEKSGDDEFFRNVLACCFSINEKGEEVLGGKAARSILRNRAGKNDILTDLEPTTVNGIETATMSIDYHRVVQVVSMIAGGLLFRDRGEKFDLPWYVFIKDIAETSKSEFVEISNLFFGLLEHFEKDFSKRETSNEDVFKYYFAENPGVMLYKLVFYGGVEVYALGSQLVGTKLQERIKASR